MDLVRKPSSHEVELDMSLSLLALKDQLVRWLCDTALPLWDQLGVDRVAGGFFETLAFNAASGCIEAEGEIRRGRVVSRQIYVFETGQRFGWSTTRSDPVGHGCHYLLERLLKPDGLFHTSMPAANQMHGAEFSLYEHAFYLFALARAQAAPRCETRLDRIAVRCLKQLRNSFGKCIGGFEESQPRTLPLKSNPHMHLLEAALAWINASGGAERALWADLASELVMLCLSRFMATDSGAVAETFDADWQPLAEGNDRLALEPGHQFEWAWLLAQWSALEQCTPAQRASCHVAIKHLTHLGETWGVDRDRGVVMNELWGDLSIKDASAKLWPQTERIKAWCAMLSLAEGEREALHACHQLIAAIRGLTSYLLAAPHGLWAEVLSADGQFLEAPCKASSFYHIVGAIEGLELTLSSLPSFARHSRRLPLKANYGSVFS